MYRRRFSEIPCSVYVLIVIQMIECFIESLIDMTFTTTITLWYPPGPYIWLKYQYVAKHNVKCSMTFPIIGGRGVMVVLASRCGHIPFTPHALFHYQLIPYEMNAHSNTE